MGEETVFGSGNAELLLSSDGEVARHGEEVGSGVDCDWSGICVRALGTDGDEGPPSSKEPNSFPSSVVSGVRIVTPTVAGRCFRTGLDVDGGGGGEGLGEMGGEKGRLRVV